MSYCIIIPNYNHTNNIETLIQALGEFQLPIIMINDGSNENARNIFLTLEEKYPSLTLVHHKRNSGKGAAVQTGIKEANKLGFQYALQIDADGQHDLADVSKLIAKSKAFPDALISGQPVYDETIPKHRLYARNITHFWVWVETLSFHIKDTMCGYRIYPVQTCVDLFNDINIGKRMDFDIEVMVRLYWKNINIIFQPTNVIYPEDGISHFRAFKDNMLISWMHTKLCFGMLIRLPLLLHRKLTS